MVPNKAAPAAVILKPSAASEGLTSREAADRLEKYGPNAIPASSPSNHAHFVGQVLGLGSMDA